MKHAPLLSVFACALTAFSAPAAPTLDDLAKFVAGVPVKDSALAERQRSRGMAATPRNSTRNG